MTLKDYSKSALSFQPLSKTVFQDGGVGRYTLPPCTTKRRTTTNLKTKNNQNYQKIELSGSPIIKELIIQTGGRGRDGQPGQRGLGGQGSGWWTSGPTFPLDKPGGTTGDRDRQSNPGFQHGEIKPQNL